MDSRFSSVRVRDNHLVRWVLRVLPARVRRCVLVSVVPCILLAPLPLRAGVLPWVDVPVWGRVLVVRPVRVGCWVLPPVLRLRELLLVRVPAWALLPAVLASVIRDLAASRKDR